MSNPVWRVERELLATPGTYPMRIVGLARLVSDAGVIMALECEAAVPAQLGLALRRFAVYWERNSSPPEMRFLPLDGDIVQPGFGPLPPRSR